MDILAQDNKHEGEKRCPTCPEGQEWHKATTEYFHRDKHSPDKLCACCKECVSKRRKAYYAQHRDQAIAYSKQYVEEHGEDTAQYQREYAEEKQAELTAYKKAWYEEHKEKQLAHKAQWYAEHKEYVSERGKQYREAHAEEKRERDRKYRETHAEEKRERDRKYKAEHKAALLEQAKQYYAEHREERLSYAQQYGQTERGIIAKRASSHNRRARKKNAEGTHTSAQLYQQLAKQDGKCFYCQRELHTAQRDSWHGDHVIPLIKHGSNDISNIVIACPRCNRKKHTRLPGEWTSRLPLPTEE